MTIRSARLEDAAAIAEIYNEAVLNSVATFDTEPRTEERQRQRLEEGDGAHPVLVACEGSCVAAWASLSRWSDKGGYDSSAEISLYVRKGCRGRGIGKKLTEAVLRRGREEGLHLVIARIAAPGAASVHILQCLGFERTGVLEEAGRKFGRWLNVILMQKNLER